MLRPEVKSCLDKVMYQLDLCKNTLGLLENRISTSESNLQSVMEYIRTEDINYKPHLAQAIVEVNDSPERSQHLFHPHLYKEQLVANAPILNSYTGTQTPASEDYAMDGAGMHHRTVVSALMARADALEQPQITEAKLNAATTSAGVYDLAELRRKLVERMEYSKVAPLPHDPTMDPVDTVPSYASSTEVRDRNAQMYAPDLGSNASSSQD